jgi:hypothetical protein
MLRIRIRYYFLLVIAAIAAIFMSGTFDVHAQVENADFRIIDVRSEHGHLIVEVQVFNPDGSHWYYENFTFQGREQFKQPRVTDAGNRLFIARTALEAPKRLTSRGVEQYYLPPGEQWLRWDRPHLDQGSILSTVQSVVAQRQITGWTKGRERLTLYPLDSNDRDTDGVAALTQRFTGLSRTAYQSDAQGVLTAYVGRLPPIDPYISSAWGTVSTFYSDANGTPGATSNDGKARQDGPFDIWSVIRGGAGNSHNDTADNISVDVVSRTITGDWDQIGRGFNGFDTSSLADDVTVSAATFEFVATLVTNDFGGSYAMVTTTPASNIDLSNADYTQTGTTKQTDTDMVLSAITADSSTFNVFTLNATGRGNISLTGITNFGTRIASDADDNEPTWAASKKDRVQMASSEESLPGDKRPKLIVTASVLVPAAAITGTIGDGGTEQEVRDGGTILVTLTDDTWVADGATFDAQRQNIIDGLDAASSPATGWNNEVRDEIGVASVVRTSATLATITLTASEVAGYAITSTETITVTVPATAVTGGGAITATPTIAITAVTETATISGTIGDGATEQEVRDGNGTIEITLANTTWVPAAASEFDNQRQNIIDGLVAADSQTYGWNNEVTANLGEGSVIRTSDTLVTITIAAGDVSDYRIVTNEVITTTVPATAIGGAALVATPTTTITGTVESAAVTGTLGGSGGTAAEIVAGGETVIITLTNTVWVADGATFNAQRQNILDNLVADDSDANGWNAMAFAVGDVARTDATVVTITLSAESGYAIPSAETITTTVPATAIVYGAALVAPETFTISPGAFATSGTRVSTAIDLQSITDLAYCAIGWETTLPTNTAVAIETSVDGGANYSTATNGSCPTGLTVGESLATITDFRVKATLTTTDTSATPLITALGLIVEDAGGSELCYQLVTTPSATLADSCGTYNGTMSFPIGPSTITSSTDPITSTADPLPNARALAGQDVAQAVTGSATSAQLFPAAGDEGGFAGLPLNDLVNEMSTVGDGLPVRFVWFIFLGIATIGAGMLAIHLTSNLFIAAGAMAAVMGFQMVIGSTGLLPGWILFAFIPLAAAFLLFRRGFPV